METMPDDEFIKLAAAIFLLSDCHGVGCNNAGGVALQLASFKVPETEEANKILKLADTTSEAFEAEFNRRMFTSNSDGKPRKMNETFFNKFSQYIKRLANEKNTNLTRQESDNVQIQTEDTITERQPSSSIELENDAKEKTKKKKKNTDLLSQDLRGSWYGKSSIGQYVDKIFISENRFPCDGYIILQDDPLPLRIDVLWTIKDNTLIGDLKNSTALVANATLSADNTLSGQVITPASKIIPFDKLSKLKL
jgi:hypothetical protein